MRTKAQQILDWVNESATEAQPPQPAQGKASARKRSRPAATRHSRKCSVCRHRDRAAIDQDFLAWHSPYRIAQDYGIADHSSIYRHAHATGLFNKRANTIRLALAPIIERAATVKVTADAIIRAVYVSANLDDDGKWANPKPNRQTREFLGHANDCKQTAATNPNRQRTRRLGFLPLRGSELKLRHQSWRRRRHTFAQIYPRQEFPGPHSQV